MDHTEYPFKWNPPDLDLLPLIKLAGQGAPCIEGQIQEDEIILRRGVEKKFCQ